MATKWWTGSAALAAQVATATFATYDVTTTRKITIGTVVISAADSGGTLTAALSALATLLNASTHPYFSTITWSSNATQIIGTADTPGAPFVFAGSATGGTGTCSDAFTISTANGSPNDWRLAANWSDGVVPVDGDTVIFKDSAISVAWGLDQASIQPALLRIDKTYTGKIGLARDFATSADGQTTNSAYPEYRDQYLKIGPTLTEIGQLFSASAAAGSGRLKLNFGTDAGTCVVYDTASTPADVNQAAVQLLANNNTTDIFVRSAPGGVGVAIGPAETSTVRKVSISDTSTSSKVFVGPGTTITTWEQQGGTNLLSLKTATITTVTVNGGQLTIEGDQVCTTINSNGGTIISNITGTIGTLNINGTSAVVDFQQSTKARTVTTTNLTKGSLKADGSVMTFTTLNDPSGKYALTAA